MSEETQEIEIDLVEIFHLLVRKIWIIILSVVIGGILVGGYTQLFVTPQYSAYSMIYILTKTTSITSLADLQMGSQLTIDFQTLATSRPVIENVIDDLNLNVTYEELLEMLTIENPQNTRILKIIVSNPDAVLAKDIANSMADSLSNRVAEVMTTDKPTTVEQAVVAEKATSPDVKKLIIIGGLIGLLLSIGVISMLYIMDDTIKDEDDVKKYLDLNTLAAIPLDKKLKMARKASERYREDL